MKKSIIFSAILISLSLTGFSQGTPDTTITLNSRQEFSNVKDSLRKKGIAFKWKEEFGPGHGGGSNYGKRGTGKCILYRYNGSEIKTRRKGGELILRG
jgi:hypothetical protein